jgi:selenocysteine-specific elongation factor
MARAIHPGVVGTAGHIDHGKSSLVKALTGIDPDRLPEEQERGLTIDLGFARFKLADGRYVGMVDVPGHERFVRNMVAGCTGLDLAILVVAADDGVMPQTREHLDILDLLAVRGGLIALTKVDMVDPQIADLAAAEVLELVQGTVLQDAELMRVSSVTGEGLDEFKQKLAALAMGIEPRPHGGPFRMPIQRVFSLPGIGTVITGIPMSGSIRPGAELEILPLGERVRLRGLHAYGGKVEEAVAGHSTALSVPDAKESGVHRGMVVATPGVFATGNAVDLDLRLIRRARTLHHRTPIRFHTGTIEAQGELLLLDRDRLGPGERATARVVLEEDICCARTDPFLLRLQNPAVTVGGGQVLRLQAAPRRYRRRELGSELHELQEAGDRPEDRIRNELEHATAEGLTVDELAQQLQLDAQLVASTCGAMADIEVHERGQRVFLSSAVAAGERELLLSVDKILQRRPNAASLVRTAVRPSRTLPQPLIDAVFDRLRAAGRVRTGSQGRILFLERLRPLPADQHEWQPSWPPPRGCRPNRWTACWNGRRTKRWSTRWASTGTARRRCAARCTPSATTASGTAMHSRSPNCATGSTPRAST